jgi:hypothetical protein
VAASETPHPRPTRRRSSGGRPYQRKVDQVQKKIIPPATFEQIKYKIVAKKK